MALLTVITNPHPTLRKKAIEVAKKDIADLHVLIDDMAETMIKKDGIGLAANQVNILKRIIVINIKGGVQAIINPTISKKSFKKETAEEGCLSVPGIYGSVKRHHSLIISGLSRKGEKIKTKVSGLLARVVQHEVDHLDGILFIDKAKDLHEPQNL